MRAAVDQSQGRRGLLLNRVVRSLGP